MSRVAVALAALWVTPAVAAPVPKSLRAAARAEPLLGTTWVGDEQPLGRIQYTFEANGVLVVTYVSTGNEYRKSTWTQDGAAVYWECNDKYVEYHATLKGGGISGEALNTKGLRWTVSLARGKER